MPDTPWWTYVQQISNHATPAQIGRDTRLDKSAPTRWSNGGGVEAAQAVKVARAYNANVLEALVAAGFITEDEVRLVEVDRGLAGRTDVDLLRELLRRAERDDDQAPAPLRAVGPASDTDAATDEELPYAADTQNQSPDEDLRTP